MLIEQDLKRLSRKFDLIVFDWDGTLFDSTALISKSIQLAVADLGFEPPSDEKASYVIGLGLAHALRLAAPEIKPEHYSELSQRYMHHYDVYSHDLHLFDGVLELLHDLRQKEFLLAIATGKSRKGLDHVLSTLPLHGLFNASRTADQTEGKPSPKMLLELIEELNVDPTRTLMIGDTTHDLHMAMNAGCPSLGVSYGAHASQQLHRCEPLAVVHSAKELHLWLSQNC